MGDQNCVGRSGIKSAVGLIDLCQRFENPAALKAEIDIKRQALLGYYSDGHEKSPFS